MTPQETFDHKQRWKPGFTGRLHSDIVDQGKTFCKRQCERHEWSCTTWTANYEHTFHFEHKHHADEFSKQWPKFINQERI